MQTRHYRNKIGTSWVSPQGRKAPRFRQSLKYSKRARKGSMSRCEIQVPSGAEHLAFPGAPLPWSVPPSLDLRHDVVNGRTFKPTMTIARIVAITHPVQS